MRRTRLLAPLLLGVVLTAGCDRQRALDTPAGAGSLQVSACTGCHGDPRRAEADPLVNAAPPVGPSGSATSPGVGAHLAHLHGGALRGAMACKECHLVPTTTLHANGQVEVLFSGADFALRQGATPRFDPATASCATTYCHGATLNAGGSNQAPTWTGGAAQAACGTCHGNPPPSHAATSTSCATCHPRTVKPDGTIDVAGGFHVNGAVEVTGGHPAGWADPLQHGHAANAQGLAGCRGCHGANLDGGTAGVSCASCHGAGWQSNCTYCHGTRTAGWTSAQLKLAAPPLGTQGQTATSDRAVGAHARHLSGGAIGPALACGDCHTVPADLNHIDGTATVTFGASARRGGAVPGWTGVGCSATYCHGGTLNAGGSNQSPVWTGGPAQAACGTCHGNPPPSHAATSTTCSSCHPGTVKADGTIDLAGGLHVNGAVEVTGGHPAGWADPTQHGYAANSQGLAGCKSCHGAALDGGSSGVSCASCHGAGWQSNCTWCHGTRTPGWTSARLELAAPPAGTQGQTATTTRAVGAHARHLAGGTIGPALACTECHLVPVDLAHLDGTPLITFGAGARRGGAVPAWNGVGCSATYCHGGTLTGGGTNKVPAWTGGSTQAACGTCHGIAPSTGRHGTHSGKATCGDCHPGSTSTSVNLATHLDGVKQVGNKVTAWNAATRACTGCHGNDTW